MKDLCRRSMLYNIKPLYLHRVFHGIRFKVNNWRLAVRDGWLFSFIGVLIPFDYISFFKYRFGFYKYR